ncbi:MAG TPA: maltotransferase domain-containing protein, partial [bacterium]|nr:maltotransferase domain-containing protein [bacterium]
MAERKTSIVRTSRKPKENVDARDEIQYPVIVIENIHPEIDGGKFPVKCIAGDTLEIEADIFKDGHDALGACVKYKEAAETQWKE